MKDDYRIIIGDRHYAGGDGSESEMSVFGSLDFSDSEYKISYTDHEGELAGCVTTISVQKASNTVYLSRDGSFSSSLLLEPKRRTSCQYNTPFGSLMLGVYTYNVESDMTEKGGRLEFAYALDVDGSRVSETELNIAVSRA